MKTTTITTLPARVAQGQLSGQLTRLGAEAVHFLPVRTQTEADGTITVLPPTLTLVLPDGADEAAFEAAVAAHAPEQSDDEARESAELAKRHAMKAELRAYLLEFLQDPELLGLLKRALAN